jgi:hypothetical protein
MLERLNEEIRRRTYVVSIFPNSDACRRIVRVLAVETHENCSRPATTSTQFRPSRIDQPKMTAFAELDAHNRLFRFRPTVSTKTRFPVPAIKILFRSMVTSPRSSVREPRRPRREPQLLRVVAHHANVLVLEA